MATLAATDEVHVFALAAVTIGPEGEVSTVDVLQPPLPDPVRDVLQQAVRGFRFEPVRIEGAPASVTTGMMLSTCIAGVGDELAVAVRPTSVGPQALQRTRMPLPRALFPGVGGRFDMKVDFTVEADGSARMNAMTLPRLSGRERRTVKQIYADWIGAMRFMPEQVNGRPVATRMVWPLVMTAGQGALPRNPTAEATCARARSEPPDAPQRADDSTFRLRDPG
jgi:hypothetical protein